MSSSYSLPTRGRLPSNTIYLSGSPLAARGRLVLTNPDEPAAGRSEESAAGSAAYLANIDNIVDQLYPKPVTSQSSPDSAPRNKLGGLKYVEPLKMPDKNVPQPGPAKLTLNSGPDEWLQCAIRNQYLPEFVMKKLCEICKEYLMEGKAIPIR